MIIEHIYNDLLNDYINISMFFNRRFVVESRGLCNGLHDVGDWFIEEVEKNHKDCINQLMWCIDLWLKLPLMLEIGEKVRIYI